MATVLDNPKRFRFAKDSDTEAALQELHQLLMLAYSRIVELEADLADHETRIIALEP